jgi:undecaprenyl-diphosphatase
MSLIQAIILAIIEGISEFLPVSSTGHMILAADAMNLEHDGFLQTFEISIQLGAILAIVMMYKERFFQSLDFYYKLFIAFLPIAIVGYLAYKPIKNVLFNPTVVAISLIIGGIVLILVDRKVAEKKAEALDMKHTSFGQALLIGIFQCFAVIPGVSRAASTIIGGVFAGLDKKQATEFSFLLAVPTMFAVTGYDLLKTSESLTNDQWLLLFVGGVVAMGFAYLTVKLFIKFIERFGFKHFGYYRIALGLFYFLLIYVLNAELSI